MKRLVLACLIVGAVEGRAAEVSRIELLPLQTVTVTEEQFLTGSRDGRPATIATELRLPSTVAARVPAVIMLHGSGGANTRDDRWSRALNDLGVATLLVDSFTGRGIVSTVADQGQLSELSGIIDAYRAFDLLAKHPRIDATRIGLLGGSRGAMSTLYASLKRFHRMYAPEGAHFAVYMSFYPPCSRNYIDDTDVMEQPIRLFHGTADDVAPLTQCLSYVKRLQAAGRDAQLTEYPGAYHGFDNPLTPVRPAGPQTTRRGCDLFEQSLGRVLNRETGLPLTRNDECLKGGGPPGYDPRAHVKAVEDVKALLQRVFKLEPAR
jgi:dienelactone hydrolase